MKKWFGLALLTLVLAATSSCGPRVELEKALTVTDVFSGWYDFGLVNGENKLVPSISFKLQNVGDTPLSRVDLLVSFWPVGADGELDSKQVAAVGDELPPGQFTELILVRSNTGYTTPVARNELFTHSQFKDFIVKVFAKKGGRFAPLGEFTVERRIIPQSTAARVP